ncbi:MAG: 3-deoxy-D-manno-octulosonic acid transferase [Bacteroidales bacterium]|nr:3-deoxy-D-manno-octulosonic acid transferase [Bacteroidales bacterium]
MRLLYTTAIYIYISLIRTAALFSGRAAAWVKGRRGSGYFSRSPFSDDDRVWWFHCASLGEFEQGRPLIERVKSDYPEVKVLLTFFSPSGYEVRKKYPLADHIIYLPPDTPRNAARFIKTFRPEKVIFIKYEFWYNMLKAAGKSDASIYLVSAVFREGQPFFKWYGRWFRKQLSLFKHLFIQDRASATLLESYGITNYTVCGDTRFDRVNAISQAAKPLSLIEQFAEGHSVVMAGSSWPTEENMIAAFVNRNPGLAKWIIAPHEIDGDHIDRIEKLFSVRVLRYSEAEGSGTGDAEVLILDNFGMLSSAYRYASVAVVGGGFGRGIHNILEPATWGIPVLFGPNHRKFREAIDMAGAGGGIPFNDSQELAATLKLLLQDEKERKRRGLLSRDYVEGSMGATDTILKNLNS